MSKAIADLTPGTGVKIRETINGSTKLVEYIYLGIDDDGNARLLRETAVCRRRMNNKCVANYDGCEADRWLEDKEDGFLARFDDVTLAALRPTTIHFRRVLPSGNVLYPLIDRRVFLLSSRELGADGDEPGACYLDALKKYYDTDDDWDARMAVDDDRSAVNWWMRSGFSASQFRYVYSGGGAGYSSASNGSFWQRPAISVAPATIVSDEGADSIFLLPEGRRTYWEIQATALLGSSAQRPKKAKLMIAETSITEATYQVSNNAKDANPVWVNCQNGGVCDLANTSKETTDYELGVKINAKASVYNGRVGEPVLIVEKEGS